MKQVSQITNSISEFGLITQILINENIAILSGHNRLHAAKKLGLVIEPTISLPEDTWDLEPHCDVPVKDIDNAESEGKHEREDGGRFVNGKFGIGKSFDPA